MGMPPIMPVGNFVGPPQQASPIDALLGQSFQQRGAPVPTQDPYRDFAALKTRFKQAREECFDQRWVYERIWWRTILYLVGRQWIYYDAQRGQWADKRLAKWIPRPVTNKIMETAESIFSVFCSTDLGAKCRPRGGDPKSEITADIADRLEPAIREEHSFDDVIALSDFWLIATGNTFLHLWFDKRSDSVSEVVPYERCQACNAVSSPDTLQAMGGACPKCGMRAFQQAMDEQGQPVGLPITGGRGRTDVCSPFEIAVPAGFDRFEDITRLIRVRWRTKSWIEAHRPDLMKALKFETTPTDRSLQLFKAIAVQSDGSFSQLSGLGSGSSGGSSEGISEYELWEKPSKDYPDGLLMRAYGDEGAEVLDDPEQGLPGPLPYHDEKGHPWFPWTHAVYRRIGGRIWGQSPLEPAITKQDQLNQLDAMILLAVQRMANPVWLEPKGAEVKKFTGEPGLVVRYNPLIAAGGAKPERIPGENVPPSIMALREQLIGDIEALTGTSDVLKGQRPPNIEAFSALQLLVERSQSRFNPVLKSRGKLYRGWYEMALHLEREFGPKDRIWTSMGPNRGWAVAHFQNADLQSGVDVIIEDGSETPKTSLGNRAAVEQLNQLGFLDRQDPEQRYTVLKLFGRTDLVPSLDANVADALREQDEFERWASSPESSMIAPPMPPPMPVEEPAAPMDEEGAAGGAGNVAGPSAPAGGGLPPAAPTSPMSPTGAPLPVLPMFATPSPLVVLYWQDDQVHNAEHRKWGLSDAGRRIFAERPDLVAVFQQHLMAHDVAAVMKAIQQQMMMQGKMPAPAPGGAQLALERSNSESGSPMNVPRGQHEGGQGRGPE